MPSYLMFPQGKTVGVSIKTSMAFAAFAMPLEPGKLPSETSQFGKKFPHFFPEDFKEREGGISEVGC